MGHADGLASLQNINGVARVTGGSHPAIAFSDFMTAALANVEPQAFPVPGELTQFETADDVVALVDRTAVGVSGPDREVVADCDGECRVNGVPEPSLDPPPTTTIPPSTTTEPSTTTTPPTTGPAGPTVTSSTTTATSSTTIASTTTTSTTTASTTNGN